MASQKDEFLKASRGFFGVEDSDPCSFAQKFVQEIHLQGIPPLDIFQTSNEYIAYIAMVNATGEHLSNCSECRDLFKQEICPLIPVSDTFDNQEAFSGVHFTALSIHEALHRISLHEDICSNLRALFKEWDTYTMLILPAS